MEGEEITPESVARLRAIKEHRHAFWTPNELREDPVLKDDG